LEKTAIATFFVLKSAGAYSKYLFKLVTKIKYHIRL